MASTWNRFLTSLAQSLRSVLRLCGLYQSQPQDLEAPITLATLERTPIACDGRITPCECSQYQLEGICWCGTDGSYVDCRNYAPATPSSLIRKLNAESFKQVDALKAAAKSAAVSNVKRKLVCASSSSSESDPE